MYIQQPNGTAAFVPPRDYSGSAFLPKEKLALRDTPPAQEAPCEPPPIENADSAPLPSDTAEDAIPTGGGRGKGGLFSGIPFLSSLLPPPRRHGGKEDGLPDWMFLAIVFFLFMDKGDSDLLPLLLLLLLWD